jgi:EpsI family protein
MSARVRLAAVALALLLPALVLGRWLLVTSAPTPDVPALTLPDRVGPWRATAENRLEARILAQIDPDAYLMRRYDAPGRTPIWLYVGIYAGRAGHGKGAHDPEVCYPAQGWEIMQSESFEVTLGDSDRDTLFTKRLEAHRGPAKESVLYWFQPANRWPARAAVEELMRVLDAARGRPQYAFVRVSGPTDGSSTTIGDLAEFAAESAASIRDAVEAVGSVGEERAVN